MYVCMYVYVYIYIWPYVYIYIYTVLFVSLCAYVYIYILYMCGSIYVQIYIYKYINIWVYMSIVYMTFHIDIYICAWIHHHGLSQSQLSDSLVLHGHMQLHDPDQTNPIQSDETWYTTQTPSHTRCVWKSRVWLSFSRYTNHVYVNHLYI